MPSVPTPDPIEVTAFLRARIAERLKCPVEDLPLDQNLLELGLQSVDAVLISGALEDHYNQAVDPTLMLNYRTITDICAKFIASFSNP